MTDRPHVVVVILNTSRRLDTVECLSSLARSTYPKQGVIVLDNSSTDGSVEAVRIAHPRVDLIELTINRGYAGNNNVGIRAALARGADWVLVLNEDTVLSPDCIALLVDIGESDRRIGIVGPLVYHHNEPNVIQSAGGRLNKYWIASHIGQNEIDRGQFTEPRRVEWISGCAIMVRRAVIEQIGMLDERFFYYWEETEWCLRVRRRGWIIIHHPRARLWHKGVQRDYRPSPSVTYYSTRNRFLMLSKHRAPFVVWLIAWGQTLRTLASWSVRPKWRYMHQHRNAMWRGILDFIFHRWGVRPA